MKKYFFVLEAFTLAITMSGLLALAFAMVGFPAAALAENNSGEEESGDGIRITNVQIQAKVIGESVRERQKQNAERSREGRKQQLEQEKNQLETNSSQLREEGNGEEIELEMEDDSNPATSLEDLKQKIEVRKQELEHEVASTTSGHQDIVENANPVRLAVHSLLASKELVGGIGPQVSKIAKEMNDSVATTTNVEAKIQSRGFLTRLFFGGDSAAADVIAQEVAKNQQRIDDLTKLLGETTVSPDIQTILKAQIIALGDAQARLADLAQKEQNQWGLFSWRFFGK